MSTQRFFVSKQNIREEFVYITGSDVNHIKNVLRLKAGDRLVVCDGCGREYDGTITELSSSQVKAAISGKREIEQNPVHLTLVQAIPKSAKMDIVVRQATELGIAAIVPIVTSRTVVRVDKEKSKKKQERWQKIAKEAAEQSQRTTIPEISLVLYWDELLKMIPSLGLSIVFWEEAKEMLSQEALNYGEHKSYSAIVGPEGGFSADEIEDLEGLGARCLSLGRQILRTETASVVALGVVIYELQRLGDRHA